MGNEALVGHALGLGNWVETHLGSYLCTSENASHRTITSHPIYQGFYEAKKSKLLMQINVLQSQDSKSLQNHNPCRKLME
jgi:hypothetical protein